MNKEIVWNIVNSLLAGFLVFLGGFSSGNVTFETLGFAAIAACIAAFIQFKSYWAKVESEYSKPKLFTFIKPI